MKGYRIQVTIGKDPKYQYKAYVAKEDGAHTWDGAWYTSTQPEQIKIWKTRGGAERWLAQRSLIQSMGAVIEEVTAPNFFRFI